jgi:hypothetical protein
MGVAFHNVRRGHSIAYLPGASLAKLEKVRFNMGGLPFAYPVDGYRAVQDAPEPSARLMGYLLAALRRIAASQPATAAVEAPLTSAATTAATAAAIPVANEAQQPRSPALSPLLSTLGSLQHSAMLVSARTACHYLALLTNSRYAVRTRFIPLLQTLLEGGRLHAFLDLMLVASTPKAWTSLVICTVQLLSEEAHRLYDWDPALISCLRLSVGLLQHQSLRDTCLSSNESLALINLFTIKHANKEDADHLFTDVWAPGDATDLRTAFARKHVQVERSIAQAHRLRCDLLRVMLLDLKDPHPTLVQEDGDEDKTAFTWLHKQVGYAVAIHGGASGPGHPHATGLEGLAYAALELAAYNLDEEGVAAARQADAALQTYYSIAVAHQVDPAASPLPPAAAAATAVPPPANAAARHWLCDEKRSQFFAQDLFHLESISCLGGNLDYIRRERRKQAGNDSGRAASVLPSAAASTTAASAPAASADTASSPEASTPATATPAAPTTVTPTPATVPPTPAARTPGSGLSHVDPSSRPQAPQAAAAGDQDEVDTVTPEDVRLPLRTILFNAGVILFAASQPKVLNTFREANVHLTVAIKRLEASRKELRRAEGAPGEGLLRESYAMYTEELRKTIGAATLLTTQHMGQHRRRIALAALHDMVSLLEGSVDVLAFLPASYIDTFLELTTALHSEPVLLLQATDHVPFYIAADQQEVRVSWE